MNPRLVTSLGGVLLMWAVPCTTMNAQDIPPETRDSAGVHIVTYGAEELSLSWQFRERFRLGGRDDGPEAFYRVWPQYVAVDAHGYLYVLDPPNGRLARFDSTGQVQWAVGRKGGGPGEFQLPANVIVGSAAEVAVFDVRKGALLWWDSAGAFDRQVSVPGVGMPRGMGFLGDALAFGRVGWPRADGSRTIDLVVASAADTTVIVSTATPPLRNQGYPSCGILGASFSPVFTPRFLWAVVDDQVTVAEGAEYIVNVYGVDGLHLSIRRAITPIKATEGLARRRLGAGMRVIRGSTQQECIIPPDEVISNAGIAATVPLIEDLTVAPDGSVWVSRFVLPDETPTTDIFNTKGAYVGTLKGQHPFPIAFLPNGDILAIETDEWDVQRVVGYTIVR